MAIFEGSRYARARVAMVNGHPVIVSRRKRWTEQRPDDRFYTVKLGDTLDSIAYQLLGDGELWWVIADVNGIIDPFEPLEAGRVLRVPSRRTVYEEVLA